MKLDILERGYKAKDKLKDLITKKVDRFEKYIKNVLGCHQIFVFGDIKKELAYVAEMTGIEILK